MLKVILASSMLIGVPFSAAPAATPSSNQSATATSIYSLGRCIVQADRGAAAKLLEVLPLDSGSIKGDHLRIAASTGCLKGALPPESSLLLRGALAQQLYLADFREFNTDPRSRSRWIDLKLPTKAQVGTADDAAMTYAWADCVVRNDTVNTEQLLKTAAGSAQEAKILEQMRPYMNACFDGQSQLTASHSELRSLFAQSGYSALVRYWTGELRVVGGDGEPAVCKKFRAYASMFEGPKGCLTEKEWKKVKAHWR